MIRLILVVVWIATLVGSVQAGEWTGWPLLVIIPVLLMMGSDEREEGEARRNWVRYWSDGGPDGR